MTQGKQKDDKQYPAAAGEKPVKKVSKKKEVTEKAAKKSDRKK